jgi:hypothetical protein
MQNEQNLTGRPAYDSSLGSDARYRSGGSGKILIAVAVFIALFGVILWLGSGNDGTTTAPGMTDPAAVTPADPLAAPVAPATDPAATVTDPAAPATEPTSPIVDPAAPNAGTDPSAPDGATTAPVPVQ